MILLTTGRHGPKETARQVPEENQQAGDQRIQANSSLEEQDEAMGECRMLALLQARLAQFNCGLYPLTGDQLLLSHPDGFTRTVPDLRAARALLKQWEAR